MNWCVFRFFLFLVFGFCFINFSFDCVLLLFLASECTFVSGLTIKWQFTGTNDYLRRIYKLCGYIYIYCVDIFWIGAIMLKHFPLQMTLYELMPKKMALYRAKSNFTRYKYCNISERSQKDLIRFWDLGLPLSLSRSCSPHTLQQLKLLWEEKKITVAFKSVHIIIRIVIRFCRLCLQLGEFWMRINKKKLMHMSKLGWSFHLNWGYNFNLVSFFQFFL